MYSVHEKQISSWIYPCVCSLHLMKCSWEVDGVSCSLESYSWMNCSMALMQRMPMSLRFSRRDSWIGFSKDGSLATNILTTMPNVSQSCRYTCMDYWQYIHKTLQKMNSQWIHTAAQINKNTLLLMHVSTKEDKTLKSILFYIFNWFLIN